MMSVSRTWLLAGFAVLAQSIAPATVGAYRTTRDLPDFEGTEGPVTWRSLSVRYSVARDPVGSATEVQLLNASARAAETWATAQCSMGWSFAGAPTASAQSGDSIVTVQTFSSRAWRELGMDDLVVGTTDLLYEQNDDGDWEIVDADVLLNGGIRWGEPIPDGSSTYDLTATLVHEFGHCLGLAHCCEPGGEEGAPVCSATPECEGATMFPLHLGAAQRTLQQDDEAGMCFLTADTCAGGPCPDCRSADDCSPEETCIEGQCQLIVTPPSCTSDSECVAGERCVGGNCTASVVGDPCVAPEECATEVCAEGACSSSCGSNDDCPDSGECVDEAYCALVGGAVGAPCAGGSDCLGGVCVAGSESAPVCSRHCSESTACPADWECRRVDASDVCVPVSQAGCAVAFGGGVGAVPPVMSALFLLSLLRRRSAG